MNVRLISYQELLTKHFDSCALSGLPENLRLLTDEERGVPSMGELRGVVPKDDHGLTRLM